MYRPSTHAVLFSAWLAAPRSLSLTHSLSLSIWQTRALLPTTTTIASYLLTHSLVLANIPLPPLLAPNKGQISTRSGKQLILTYLRNRRTSSFQVGIYRHNETGYYLIKIRHASVVWSYSERFSSRRTNITRYAETIPVRYTEVRQQGRLLHFK